MVYADLIRAALLLKFHRRTKIDVDEEVEDDMNKKQQIIHFYINSLFQSASSQPWPAYTEVF